MVLLFSFCGHSVDALAPRADEGRSGLRYASGSWRTSFDPRISEWGNLARVVTGYRNLNEIGLWGERGEVKHLSTRRKRYSVSSGERKRRRLNLACVIAGRRCAWGVVGHIRFLSAGGWHKHLREVNSMGRLTVVRESRVTVCVLCLCGVCTRVAPDS